MVTAKKTPAKVAPVKRRIVKPKVEAPAPKPEAKKDDSTIGKIIGLIEWVDNPFKLFTVILLGFLAFAGYFAWDSRQVILQAITTQDKMPQLAKQENLLAPARSLMKDVDGLVVLGTTQAVKYLMQLLKHLTLQLVLVEQHLLPMRKFHWAVLSIIYLKTFLFFLMLGRSLVIMANSSITMIALTRQ
jgi:hypothetical protein